MSKSNQYQNKSKPKYTSEPNQTLIKSTSNQLNSKSNQFKPSQTKPNSNQHRNETHNIEPNQQQTNTKSNSNENS